MLYLAAAQNEPHGVGTMVMSTVAMTSREGSADRWEGRGQTRWKAKVGGGGLIDGDRNSLTEKEVSRSCTRFGLLSLDGCTSVDLVEQ
jgi:hypothetical protein